MKKSIQELEFNRETWLNLIEKKDLKSAIKEYENYIKEISAHLDNEILKPRIKEEIETSKLILTEKIRKQATKIVKKNDYIQAFSYYYELFKLTDTSSKTLSDFQKLIDKLEDEELIKTTINILETLVDKNPKIYRVIANNYAKIKNFELAIENLEKCSNNRMLSDYINLGSWYCELFNDGEVKKSIYVEKMIEYYEKYLSYDPKNRSVILNICLMAPRIRDYETAKYYYKKLFEIGEFKEREFFEYGTFCLSCGELEGYYKYIECRLKEKWYQNYLECIPPGKKWMGEDLKDKTILVQFEQGFGDQLWTLSWVKMLVPMAKKVYFAVRPELYKLFDSNKQMEINFIKSAPNSKYEEIDYDYYVMAMSIPGILGLKREDLMVKPPYLQADEQKIEYFRKNWFNNDKFKIGFSYSGNLNGMASRNVPIEKLLDRLSNLEDVELYCVQKNGIPAELYKKYKIQDVQIDFSSFVNTAAAIENLDLLISTDNVILNLAGAMNKRTFGLFNYWTDSRWFDLTGEDVVYWASVKPFVNEQMDDWEPTIDKIVQATEKLIAQQRV